MDAGDDSAREAYVSRGALKLRAALDALGVDVSGLVCADLGCSTGGFTDCLLQAGALRVFAVDTAYGQLAWKLRQDPRVQVMERSNALHVDPPQRVDLVVIDLGWTRQRLAVPAALRWIGTGGRIISLVKPHYEIGKAELARIGVKGVLPESEAERVFESVRAEFPGLGVEVHGAVKSPIRGGGKGAGSHSGNAEWLVLLTPSR